MIRQDLSIDIGVDAIASRPTTAYLGAMVLSNQLKTRLGENQLDKERIHACVVQKKTSYIHRSMKLETLMP